MSYIGDEESFAQSAEGRALVKDFNKQAMMLGLQGVTIVVSSGDDGVAGYTASTVKKNCGYHPGFPAASPYVTAVGGTQGVESGATAEIACSVSTGGGMTTGGGFSVLSSPLPFQKKAIDGYFAKVSPAPMTGYNRTGRGFPDVSLAGAYYEVACGGAFLRESGTSAATPVFAGMVSLVNSARLRAGRPPVGFLNPVLYASEGSFANDILSGDNRCTNNLCCEQGFHTAPGWDPLTGFGSVDFRKFYNLLMTGSASEQSARSNTDVSLCDFVAAINPNSYGIAGWTCNGYPPVPSTMVCSSWAGITCEKGEVIGINLSGHLLSGTLPASIGLLTSLRYLDVSNNLLTGTIPSSFSLMLNLIGFSIEYNGFSGPLPSDITDMTKLQLLYLGYNNFQGKIPTEYGLLTNLKSINLHYNLLSGSIPSSYAFLTGLTYLPLSFNKLSGTIPKEIGKMSKLVYISLDGNYLSGTIPYSLCELSNLKHLSMEGNRFTCYPPCLTSISSATIISTEICIQTKTTNSSKSYARMMIPNYYFIVVCLLLVLMRVF